MERAEVAKLLHMRQVKILILIPYLLLCVGISGFALGTFAKLVQEHLAVEYSYQTEATMVLGQVLFQWLFMAKSSWSERISYATLALTVSMVGSILLFPLLAYAEFVDVSSLTATTYFAAVVLVIFSIHHWLIKINRLPRILTSTWVLYRLLLLTYLLVGFGG